jgi:hypothetical protein
VPLPVPPEGAGPLAGPPAAALVVSPGGVVVSEIAVALPLVAVALVVLASTMVIWRAVVLVSMLAPGRWQSTLTAI